MLSIEHNPTTYPTTEYPEAERVLRVIISNMPYEEVFTKVDLIDGELPEDVDEQISRAVHRKYGLRAMVEGYEDVTNLFGEE